jgi:hypothetical protein
MSFRRFFYYYSQGEMMEQDKREISSIDDRRREIGEVNVKKRTPDVRSEQ